MEFLSEIFVKFWKEVIVAVMLTATLPFIRKYVRQQRAKILGFLREKERLKLSLLEEEKKRKEAESKYQTEAEEKRKAQEEAVSLRVALEKEQKARQEAERKYQAEAQEKLKAKEEAEHLRGVSSSKVSKLMRTFKMFSGPKEAEENTSTQNNEEIERLRLALVDAERLRQIEIEEKRKAQAEAERLRGLLDKAEQELKAIEAAKPAPNSMTAKLTGLLKSCEALPYPNHSDIGDMDDDVFKYIRNLLPPEGDILRMKVMNAIVRYIQNDYNYYDDDDYEYYIDEDDSIMHKCLVLYALIIIAEGIAEKQVRIDDNKKLTWKTASPFIDKIRKEHFDEHPEISKPLDYETRSAKDNAGKAFGEFPPEIILADKEFINAILSAAKG